MKQQAFNRRDWQAMIDAHPLESHNHGEWLRYGMVLPQTILPGPDVDKQQQQFALAFDQAQKEGITAEKVAVTKRLSVMLRLRESLTLACILDPDHLWAKDRGPLETGASAQLCDPLRALTPALRWVFALELPKLAAVRDQLLLAKRQLRSKAIVVAVA